MHEMGIAMQIVEIATGSIPAELTGVPVEVVTLKIGKLAAVVPDSLRFCFEVITRDTPLAGARLEIEEVPVVARCGACGAQTEIAEPPFVCAECGAGKIEFLSGRELLVKSIELADEPGEGKETG
jgi:hydrogenase nickel incorporation protein HypA/HybF